MHVLSQIFREFTKIEYKAGDKGGAVGAEASVDDVTIYQFTEAGLALQATLKGTKFWLDKDLN